MQFLYADGTDAHFMDTSSYEQLAIPEAGVADALRWTQAQRRGRRAVHRRRARRRAAAVVGRARGHRDRAGPARRHASGGGDKPATLETGATVRVPLFVNVGDRVKVQTETGDYMSRA